MKTKIVMTRSLLPLDQNYIIDGLKKLVGESFELVAPESYDEEGICRVCADADVLLGPFVTRKILDTAKQLKLIQVPWTGMDTFDFSAMQGSDVPVCNSHSNAIVVAELGFAIIMDLLKKISYHDRKMRTGNWNRDQKPLDLKSKMLGQQKVCIVGYGNIGSRLGNMIKAFGAEVSAVNVPKLELEDVKCFGIDETETAVRDADIVVIAVPLIESTKRMVNSSFISNMKDNSFLVLLSRAGVVDEDAVYDGLILGKLAGYGSDVWWRAPKRGESESFVSDKHRFEELDNVVLSPHRAGFSENSLPHLDDVIVNLARLIKGEELLNIVKTDRGY